VDPDLPTPLHGTPTRLIVDGWFGDDWCTVPLARAVAGVALGVDFPRARLPEIEVLSDVFDLGDSIAKMMVYPNVLVPYPARDPQGVLHSWTDSDGRHAKIFDDIG
jgi:hypothetical protein